MKTNLVTIIEMIGEVIAAIAVYVLSVLIYIGFILATVIGFALVTIVAAGQSMLRKEAPMLAMKQSVLLNLEIIGKWLENFSEKKNDEE